MSKYSKIAAFLFAAIAIFALILNPATAIDGAKAGIETCLQSLIPSLFPFFILSSMITSTVHLIPLNFLSPICNLCGIPRGAEYLLITGLLGGYPVGAKAVADAKERNDVTIEEAQNILALCNNAGPSFIFGIIGNIFHSFWIPLIIWIIQISSAILTSLFIGKETTSKCNPRCSSSITAGKIMENSLKAIASVCGWVILFRILISLMDQLFLAQIPLNLRVLITGILELANGSIDLSEIKSESLRFIFSNIILSLGGICVLLQTSSVAGAIFSCKQYIFRKSIQCLISIILSLIVTFLTRLNFSAVIGVILLFIIPILCKRSKKRVAIRNRI